MKVLLFATALIFATNAAFAHEHEETKKVKHDKEHQHVKEASDHEHEDAHHKEHDHKAHHPEHQDAEAPKVDDIKKKK